MPFGRYYVGFGYYWDSTYILVIVGLVITALASMHVRSTFNKYSKIGNMSNLTGAQAAERILRAAGIYDVAICQVSGNLSDNYNPRKKTLNLSENVYNSTSVAAIGVAAHECGHAIQHQTGYGPLKVRSAIVPVAQFGSGASWFFIVLGIFMSAQPLIYAGIILFSFAVLFQLVTLPVEFNASKRALQRVEAQGIIYGDEVKQTRKVLTAAALTYVAGAVSVILQLLRLIILFGGRRND